MPPSTRRKFNGGATKYVGSSKPNPSRTIRNRWYYPPDLENDLKDLALPTAVKEEVFACAWEYTRCVIPQYTNWPRYVAFMRIIVMGIIAEFRGTLVDVTAGDEILGYNLSEVLDDLFLGTADRYGPLGLPGSPSPE